MPMGMGGGKDSSGPQGLGADAFGGRGRSNRIAFYMDDIPAFQKVALRAKENRNYTAHINNIKAQYNAYDPAAHLRKSMGVVPLAEQLQPGVYDLGKVHYEQLRDLGIINQYDYDQYNMWGNQPMPTGKNYPLHEQPGVLEYNMAVPNPDEPSPTFNNSLINSVFNAWDPVAPLNTAAPMNTEGLNPDLNSSPTGYGSYGWSR